MYGLALELLLKSFGDYWPSDIQFSRVCCDLVATRLRDIIFIKSNYPDTGGLSRKGLAKTIDAMFPDRQQESLAIANAMVDHALEFLQSNSPRDL